jgi:hypothetical protein
MAGFSPTYGFSQQHFVLLGGGAAAAGAVGAIREKKNRLKISSSDIGPICLNIAHNFGINSL